jgi:type I restriction enzyme S subunit
VRAKLAALHSSAFPLTSIGKLLQPVTGIRYGTGTPPPVVEPSESSAPFVRATDIKDNEIKAVNLLHIAREQPTFMEKCRLAAGEVIIVRSGVNTGDCALVPDWLDGAYAAYDLILRFRAITVPDFVVAFLDTDVGRLQLNLVKGRAAQPHINAEEVGAISIPLPPLAIQRKLVAKMQAAREARKEKLREADELLASLDIYLLETLSLTPPRVEQRVTFAVQLRDINLRRFDAFFYMPTLRKTEEFVRAFKPVMRLESLLTRPPMNGLDARTYGDVGQRYLRVQNVRPYDLLLDDVKFVTTDFSKDVSLKAGDILLTRKGTFGVAALVPSNAEDCLISSEIILLRLKAGSHCLPEYLIAWLNSSLARTIFDRHKAGGIMGHLTQDVVAGFPIPLPDSKVQETIAAEVRRCREQARRSRIEAEADWQAAKRHFEQQLLGADQQ